MNFLPGSVIIGACLIASALIVAWPGLERVHRESKIRAACEEMIAGRDTIDGRVLTVERCVGVSISGR